MSRLFFGKSRGSEPPAQQPSIFSSRWWLRNAGSIAAFTVMIFFVWSSNVTRMQIFVVSGLPHAYAVKIDGRLLRLEPGVPQPIALSPWKTFRVEADYGKVRESYETDLDPWTLSIWSSRTVVLNPDRLATLVRMRQTYSPEGRAFEPKVIHTVEVVSGRAIHQLFGVEDAFAEFPAALGPPRKSTRVHRGRDRLAVDMAALERLPQAARASDPRKRVAAERQIRRYLELIEMDESERRTWLARLPAPYFAVLAASELDRHPPAVEWHLAYQQLPDHVGREADLMAEYRRRQEAHPGDAEWLYLLSEAIADPLIARRKLEQAASLPRVSPWVFHGLAWSELQSGRFEAARAWASRSHESAPESADFRRLEAILAVATGDAAGAFAAGSQLDPMIRNALLAEMGKVEATEEMATEMATARSEEAAPAGWEREAFAATGFCHPHGLACFEQRLAGQDTGLAGFWLGLIRRDSQLATDHFPVDDLLSNHLLMAVVFADDTYHRGKAAELLAARGFAAGTAARALRRESFRREELMAASLPLAYKPAILYLAGKDREDGEMIALARKLNFLPHLGQLLLDREMARAAARGA